jgi:FkbM family methyltransferase
MAGQITDIINELFVENSGTYVDIGAYLPRQGSNTYQLYQRGWSGLVIDPFDLAHVYKEVRPRDVYLRTAIGNKKETRSFYVWEKCYELASFNSDWANRIESPKIIYQVDVDTLENVLKDYPTIRSKCSFCSIDVEGFEKEVIEGINFSTFQPKIIVVESVSFRTKNSTHQAWERLLYDVGYLFLKSGPEGINRFYVKKLHRMI